MNTFRPIRVEENSLNLCSDCRSSREVTREHPTSSSSCSFLLFCSRAHAWASDLMMNESEQENLQERGRWAGYRESQDPEVGHQESSHTYPTFKSLVQLRQTMDGGEREKKHTVTRCEPNEREFIWISLHLLHKQKEAWELKIIGGKFKRDFILVLTWGEQVCLVYRIRNVSAGGSREGGGGQPQPLGLQITPPNPPLPCVPHDTTLLSPSSTQIHHTILPPSLFSSSSFFFISPISPHHVLRGGDAGQRGAVALQHHGETRGWDDCAEGDQTRRPRRGFKSFNAEPQVNDHWAKNKTNQIF